MRAFIVNLARATARRSHMLQQCTRLGLKAEFHEAVDGRQLTSEQYTQVDRNTRRRMGLKPQADGSIANWLSQRQIMEQIVENGPEIITILEDDAELAPELPSVLAALEQCPLAFDIVKLNRRTPSKPFVPCMQLSTGHSVGRVRYHDFGCEGYVITREAARRFLAATPKMMWEIDQAINYYWDNGLNVFYLDPPVVFHGGQGDSQIEADRSLSRQQHRSTQNPLSALWRRGNTGIQRYFLRHRAFRRRIQEDEMDIGKK